MLLSEKAFNITGLRRLIFESALTRQHVGMAFDTFN